MGWKQDIDELKKEVLALEQRCAMLDEVVSARGDTAQANAMRTWLDNRVREAMGTFSSYAAELQAAELASSESEGFAKGRADVISEPFDFDNKTWRGEAIQVKVCRSENEGDAQGLLAAAFNQLAGERFEVPLYDENLVAQLWIVNPANPWPWTFIRQIPTFKDWSDALQTLDNRIGPQIKSAISSHTAHTKWQGGKGTTAGAGMPRALLATLSMLEDADKFAPGYEQGSTLPRRICGNYGRGPELVGVRVRISYGNTNWLDSQKIRILESEYLVTRANQNGSEVTVTALAHYIATQQGARWYFNARFVDQRDAHKYSNMVFWYSGTAPTFTTGAAFRGLGAHPSPQAYEPAWVGQLGSMSKPAQGVKTLVTNYLNASQDVPEERRHSYYATVKKWRGKH